MPRPVWTAEQARAMGAKGRQAKALAQEQKRQLCATIAAVAQDSGWAVAHHARVRALLDESLSRLEEEARKVTCDGQRLNWLASALERLAELERVLDGRPLPGSRRPLPESKDKPQPRGPVQPLPSPAPPAPPAPTLTEPPEL